MSGWLFKWTNYLRGYEKRWFILSNGYLSYYRNQEEMDHTCRGTLSLQGAVVEFDESNKFVISNGETFHVRAINDQDKQKWVDALIQSKDLLTVSKSDVHIGEENSMSSIIATLTRKQEDVKTCHEVVSRHGQELQETFSKMKNVNTNPANYAKELEERMEMFCSSTSVLIKACADYTHQSGKVVDLITKTKHLARISSSEDESQVYYDCEDVEPSSEASHSFVDNIRVHKLYSAVVSKDDQAGPSSSPGGPRRKRVPDRPPVPMNIWSTLKNAVNSDMSKMALPVAFSEPLSALQRLNEDFEYSEILDKASNVDDPGEQLAYVAGFAVSAYSNSSNRVTKPFNPLLGETFECDRTDDRGWKSISEQVSHHPPISAVHCEGRQWECWQEQSLITKFRGQYLQITPVGEVNLKFHSGRRYIWKKVTTNIRNIIFGKLYVDHEGEMEIKCHTTGFKCKITFILPGFFSGEQNKIKGVVTDAKNNTQYHINGGYESRVEIIKASDLVKGKRGKTLSTIPPLIVWEKEASPPDSEKYYCFTLFACQLNEIEDGVAPTDSRHRPDQRLMEEGKWDAANELKLALEEAQRKRGQESKPPHKPVWFSQQKDPDTKTVMYKHNGDYWECKKKKDWKRCPQIFTA
ncbi:hypothetical protein GE061_012714 [Apolygus lucorum]|uniref:Oxysterol-binding protein n=1 Tax=Apolygus lucorum TaxID=248454 RepID=A0A6A4JXQ4_APOLU|nr:hypothetical protein GE061_012714 [Apolygus lucorum]